ncbi:MAG: DUF6268 family outer membrane beta-barrel protein [Candidatus Omnitrophica bacterium]|nr:DUF6268 family outer membrane beta-barrel protein [Candidatus Omnitrophota bacterium]
MLKNCFKMIACLFIIVTFFTFSPPFSQAESISKDDAMAMALSKLEGTPSELQLANISTQPQAAVGQLAEDTEFRHRLKEVITVEKEAVMGLAMDAYSRLSPARSLKTEDGKISILDNSTELSYAFKAFDKLPVELSLDTQYIALNDKEGMPVSLPAKLTGMGFGVEATLPFFNIDKTYFRVKLKPTFNSDDWNVNTATFRLPAQAFLIYQPNEKLTLIGGAAIYPGMSHPVLPILGMIYKPNEKLTFNLVPSRPTISYAFTDKFSGFLEGGVSLGEYRVNRDGFKSAMLTYQELHTGLGLKLQMSKYIGASLSAGRMFNRYLQYDDSRGKVGIKNGYYSEFRMEMDL